MIELFNEDSKQKIYIITGGTLQHITPHYSVCAPAYGTVGGELESYIRRSLESFPETKNNYRVHVIRTRMAEKGNTADAHVESLLEKLNLKYIETNEDLKKVVDHLVSLEDTRCIVMSSAICDFKPEKMTTWNGDFQTKFGKDQERLSSKKSHTIFFEPSNKIIDDIRKDRKDIFLVSFKTTSGLSKQEAYSKALYNLKKSSSNLVFVNDIKNKHNGVVTPEEFTYWEDTRDKALKTLANMIIKRIQLTFQRTKVISEQRVPLEEFEKNNQIPKNFLHTMKYLLDKKAFKPFHGKTTGHFGCKIIDDRHPLLERLCSIRKIDHNTIFDEGMGGLLRNRGENGEMLFVGGKPSVGEHTQDIIYQKYGDRIHSIVHFHCPLKEDSRVPKAPQQDYECGSDQCGQNTSSNMKNMDIGIYAVHLEGHGPNIAFHKNVETENLIKFIEDNWDLSQKTGGLLES